MTAVTRRRKNAPSPLVGEGEGDIEGEGSGMYAIANPPQPPFFKGGSGVAPGALASPPFGKGGQGGFALRGWRGFALQPAQLCHRAETAV